MPVGTAFWEQFRWHVTLETKSLETNLADTDNGVIKDQVALKSQHKFIRGRGALVEGNLSFCSTGSLENYFGLVVQQNNNNPKFQDWHIWK